MGWDGIPADVFQAILLRIPLSPRRRIRLVCRHWRDVIDERTPPEPGARAKVILAFFSRFGYRPSRAFVASDIPGGGSMEMVWPDSDVFSNIDHMIGTCNGLLCLWRRSRQIAVINPVTGEWITVDLPTTDRPILLDYRYNEAAYSFGYHPGTGQYKILHVPCHEHVSNTKFDAVHVFTLGGDGSWREVPAPAGSSCDIRFGFVTIDGVTYWANAGAERIMSFDLKDDRVVPFECPPMPAAARTGSDRWRQHHHLTDVRGRLGVAISCRSEELETSTTEVWVLEGGREESSWTWVKQFTLVEHVGSPPQKIALPHVVHGEHILTTTNNWGPQPLTLSAQLPRKEGKRGPCLMLGAPRHETAVASVKDGSRVRAFAYVETREPLLVYGDGRDHGR